MKAVAKLMIAVVVASGVGYAVTSSASAPSTTIGKVTLSGLMAPKDYELLPQDGFVAVTDQYNGVACTTRLLDPTSLHKVRTLDSCPSSGSDETKSEIVTDFTNKGDEIRVSVTTPSTHKAIVGPVLMTIDNWGWNHSAVTSGEGKIWIYGLDATNNKTSTLLEVSARSGVVVHRFAVDAGADPYLFVDADGLWLTPGIWGGSFCTTSCTLWRVAPGSSELAAIRTLGVGTQWLVSSGHSIYADVLTSVVGGYRQAIWRLDGPRAHVAYAAPATLLTSPDFGFTGYVVVGSPKQGYYTLSQLGKGRTPVGIGDCDTTAPLSVVRIDPATGRQTYVASIPLSVAGPQLDCHLYPSHAFVRGDAVYFLAGQWGVLNIYQRVVRVSI